MQYCSRQYRAGARGAAVEADRDGGKNDRMEGTSCALHAMRSMRSPLQAWSVCLLTVGISFGSEMIDSCRHQSGDLPISRLHRVKQIDERRPDATSSIWRAGSQNES
jgi:hypothetical protein